MFVLLVQGGDSGVWFEQIRIRLEVDDFDVFWFGSDFFPRILLLVQSKLLNRIGNHRKTLSKTQQHDQGAG